MSDDVSPNDLARVNDPRVRLRSSRFSADMGERYGSRQSVSPLGCSKTATEWISENFLGKSEGLLEIKQGWFSSRTLDGTHISSLERLHAITKKSGEGVSRNESRIW